MADGLDPLDPLFKIHPLSKAQLNIASISKTLFNSIQNVLVEEWLGCKYVVCRADLATPIFVNNNMTTA